MFWFAIALVAAVAIAVGVGNSEDFAEGVFALILSLLLGGVIAAMFNGFFTDVSVDREVTAKCNLAPITAGATSMAAVSGDTFYYRCEGNSDFAPSETDPYSDEVKVFGSERAHVVIEKDVRHNYFWSVFNDEETTVKIYVPNNLLATSLDNPVAK